ncbi:50S ribosomal protein L17 [Liquorilactobacillus satsumensis]|uniref:Large ribosomal subunit protein bL17 n=1 Tax=Liquorilactobacillus satsumensis DSM 16230 = JCM 12392 TaxID=1423801 RepID=A0A0R1V352_9LACO|nr:50S ribosomal protein L17 [Liquorilactobacillus satsumensis]KRL97875.1 50S ribosomal protein L17P [Liquorilactobacillus satsumensis DSM 16230 = JCM 12392]MCC7667619.1 50S ribosomal protein L17 [Liquorilactobacillus satsumensis]MCP9313179.1 50S ribosomal protein L17 [Liquorilactobacillus satsumensis]MCP9329416.1 50S ribosomal protein L17 [Liquorilactobacillus satsumensis]MCP9357907.1 50S ribosomal protein L17 [Liquorilactobacillus satsumensis]
MGYRKLGRTSGHRKALLRNLTTDLLVNEKIVTTEARAKEVRKTAEKMISLGKKGDLPSRRRAAAYLMDVVADVKEDGDDVVVQTALQKLFSDVADRFKERNGGYTRILKMEERRGDAAKMVVLELVD